MVLNKKQKIIIGSGAGIGLLLLALFKKSTTNMFDAATNRRIASLQPILQPLAISFLQTAQQAGIDLRISRAFITYDDQNKVYAQGRTAPGSIVTNATGGHSWHNFGLAFDVVVYQNGKPVYTGVNWQQIGALGKASGLEWGGDFPGSAHLGDYDHFEKKFGHTLSELDGLVQNGNVLPNGLVVLS